MPIFKILAKEVSYKVLHINAESKDEVWDYMHEFDTDTYKELDGAYEWDVVSIKEVKPDEVIGTVQNLTELL